MIYLVSNQQQLFESDSYKCMSVEDSLEEMKCWNIIQADSETSGRDPHLCELLCFQFGNDARDIRIVVDCTTVDIKLYKPIIESKTLIFHNANFDLKFLYNEGIVPKKIYDTMVAEQLRYLAYPKGMYRVSLKAVAERYLGMDIDKTTRGEIVWRGLDPKVILYAAGDVCPLEQIMNKQIQYFKSIQAIRALEIECDFTLCNAYYEWCGVKLDVKKWTTKVKEDKEKLNSFKKQLDEYVVSKGNDRFFFIDLQGDLFNGFNTDPQCNINWNSSEQAIPFFEFLGFNCETIDKKTKEKKKSLEESVLKPQKGIADDFLKIYFNWTEANKLCSTYGQQYLNAVNPKTGRIHTCYRQLGTDTGRLACGSQEINTDLAKLKGLPLTKTNKTPTDKICAYPQCQNLPNDERTRSCFICEEGNSMIAIDYSGEESRLLASLSNDKAMLEVFINGEDMHSKVAYMIYPDKIPRNTPINDIKTKYKHLRQAAKGPEFCFAFLGNWATLVATYGMSPEEAQQIEKNYKEGFYGATKFQEECKKFTSNNGYILICKETGHKAFWWDWEEWYKRQRSSEFWEDYRKCKADNFIPTIYKEHFAAKSKWDKNSVNSRTQGLGAVIFKHFNYRLFRWIVENNLFNKVKFCVPAHDEIVLECPEELTDLVVEKTKYFMSSTGELYCHRLPMPAEEAVGKCWIH